MIFHVPRLIMEISKVFTLEAGDLILTGTPEGVGPIKALRRFFWENEPNKNNDGLALGIIFVYVHGFYCHYKTIRDCCNTPL